MVKWKRGKGQTIQWLSEKGGKDRQYNGYAKKGKRTDNTMVKWKRGKGQTIQWLSEKEQKDKQWSNKHYTGK